MGTGCTRVSDRVAASLGELSEAKVSFERSVDVRLGGVLTALPSLLINGLLQHTPEHFTLPKGFYGIPHVFIALAFMALCRIKQIETLRRYPPGDLGILLGLDRIPEVKTLRDKLSYLARNGDVAQWSSVVSQEWMSSSPEMVGYLYVDGHVRVYHGHQARLPRQYVTRQRLCLRGTTDYWINDALGKPFFAITTPINPGLIKILRDEIVPRLEREVPGQPTAEELSCDPLRCRFAIIFDREGYSPTLFADLFDRRISCYTYRKYNQEPWPEEEFISTAIEMPHGELVALELAERQTMLSGKILVREVRKLSLTGHQTSLITTDYSPSMEKVAATMFARWSQENFFRYMKQHYGLDRLLEYQTEEIPGTTPVVNPAWRTVAGDIKSIAGKLARKRAIFGGMVFNEDIEPAKIAKYEQKKAEVQEDITLLTQELIDLKEQRKGIPRHIPLAELSPDQQFKALANGKKQLADTIKMIAYRSETAMAELIKPHMKDAEEARALLCQLYSSEADIVPDESAKTLTVNIHAMTNPRSNRVIRELCDQLTATETTYPGSELRLMYKLVPD